MQNTAESSPAHASPVTFLPCRRVTVLLCYCVTVLPCYRVTALPCHLLTVSPVYRVAFYRVTFPPCKLFLPCHRLTALRSYRVTASRSEGRSLVGFGVPMTSAGSKTVGINPRCISREMRRDRIKMSSARCPGASPCLGPRWFATLDCSFFVLVWRLRRSSSRVLCGVDACPDGHRARRVSLRAMTGLTRFSPSVRGGKRVTAVFRPSEDASRTLEGIYRVFRRHSGLVREP